MTSSERSTPRVLITDHVFPGLDPEREVLGPCGADIVVATATDEETLTRLARGVDGILVCFAPLPGPVIDAAASGGCRIIARYGIGYDNVAVDVATHHGIVVTNVPDYCLDEVADHAMAMLLAAARGLVGATREVAGGGWAIDHAHVHRLAGRRLALIGLGAIGRRVAERARAFGIEVTGYDPFLDAGSAVPGVSRAPSLDAALRDADFVSLHAPATPENHHLVNRETIAMMERSPVLINTARGALVDLDAVVEALDAGQLSGAALDVTEQEPLPDGHPLRTHPRAIITPHMAFHSVEATLELQRRAAMEIRRALNGEPPDRPVNPEVLG